MARNITQQKTDVQKDVARNVYNSSQFLHLLSDINKVNTKLSIIWPTLKIMYVQSSIIFISEGLQHLHQIKFNFDFIQHHLFLFRVNPSKTLIFPGLPEWLPFELATGLSSRWFLMTANFNAIKYTQNVIFYVFAWSKQRPMSSLPSSVCSRNVQTFLVCLPYNRYCKFCFSLNTNLFRSLLSFVLPSSILPLLLV